MLKRFTPNYWINGIKLTEKDQGGKHLQRIRVLIIAPSLDILGGQSVQADRLMERLCKEPTLEVEFLPINPRLPGPLRKLQRIKYVRTLVTSLAYYLSLLARVRAMTCYTSYPSFLVPVVIDSAILVANIHKRLLRTITVAKQRTTFDDFERPQFHCSDS